MTATLYIIAIFVLGWSFGSGSSVTAQPRDLLVFPAIFLACLFPVNIYATYRTVK
jgi:hypothetical protein